MRLPKRGAYTEIAKAQYTGVHRTYTLDAYINTHVSSHATLAEKGEPIAESKKSQDFLDGILDSRLEVAKTHRPRRFREDERL